MNDTSNFIAWLIKEFYEWGGATSPKWFYFWLRLSLSLAVITLFCHIAFQNGSRNPYRQIVVAIGVFFIANLAPVEKLQIESLVVKTWLLVVNVFAAVVLPRVLPRFVMQELGQQQLMARVLYGIIAILIIGNLIKH